MNKRLTTRPERHCFCDRYVPGDYFVHGRDCHPCWLWANVPEYRTRYERAPGKPIPMVQQAEWIPTTELIRGAVELASKVPPNVVGVVGIPRSGLIPASVIASILHLPLYELQGNGTRTGELRLLSHGRRGNTLKDRVGPLLVVDDSCFSGTEMRSAKDALMGKQAVFAAVLVRPLVKGSVDLYARLLENPHLLEWNLLNNAFVAGLGAPSIYGAGIAVDLDGIILHDAHSGGQPGGPYMVPRVWPVPIIVTGRYESSRGQTEEQLRSWGTQWTKLVMYPDGESATHRAIAEFKAEHYEESDCGFFVESEPEQAEVIFTITGKPVICPRAGKVWQKPPPPPPVPPRGPGTELKRLLAEMGIASKSGCGCEDKAAKMDAWDVEGCRTHRDEIAGWLRDKAAKWGWANTLTAACAAAATGLAFNRRFLADPFRWLVDEAIRRAEEAMDAK